VRHSTHRVRPFVLIGRQHLAAAVIKQALADALDPMVPGTVQQDAQYFLALSHDFRFWCRMGGFEPRMLLRNGWHHLLRYGPTSV
jgi:hypothetical protein